MDRPRNRKPVTYGSSKADQPHSKTTSARDSTTKRIKGSPSRPRQQDISNNNTLSRKDERKSRLRSLKTATTVHSEYRADADSSIYDLPSSDEEAKTNMLPRKRRKNDSNGNAVMRRNYLDCQDPDMTGAGSDPPHSSIVKTDTGNARPGNRSPRTRISARDRDPLEQNQPREAPSIIKNFTVSPPAKPHTTQAAKESQHHPDDSKPPRSVDINRSLASSSGSGEATRSLPGNATPPRRRLIDSLGTKDHSNDVSPKLPIESPLRSASIHRSPSQLEDIKSPSLVTESQRESFAQDSAVPHSSHVKGSTVTYARQRSFLDDIPLASGLLCPNDTSAPEQFDPFISPSRDAGGLAPTRSFAVEGHQDDGTVRSIHELRQAGGNARYRGAVESIFEELEDSHTSVSGRCNSLTQLCGKLLDSRLARRFVECGFDKRLLGCLSANLDVVSLTLAYCVFGLTFNGRSMPYLFATAAWPKLLNTSPVLLDTRDDVTALIQARGSNLSRHVQKLVRDIVPQITSALFRDVSLSKLSPRILALHCLKRTITAYQEKGDTPGSLPTPFLQKLVKLILSELPNSGKITVLTPDQSLILVPGLSILEAHTTSGVAIQKEQLDTIRLLSDMNGLLRIENSTDAISQQIQTLYIRVLLNVTNSNPTLCDEFGAGKIVQQLTEIVLTKFGDLSEESLAQENNALNTVILALGALINVTEQSEAARAMFLQPDSNTQSLLDRLLRLFSAYAESTSKVCLSTIILLARKLTHSVLGTLCPGSAPQRSGGIPCRSHNGVVPTRRCSVTSETVHAAQWTVGRQVHRG